MNSISRKSFLGGCLAAPLVAAASGAAKTQEPKGRVRFCAFADIHYFPTVFPHSTFEWLDKILGRAVDTKCDFVIHMGDLVHMGKPSQDYVDHYNNFQLPTYHTPGNHDFDQVTAEQRMESFKLQKLHYHFDMNGFRFIVTDTNHVVYEGKTFHYGLSNYQKIGRKDEKAISRLGGEQLEWLKATIEESPYPCIITSHDSYERNPGIGSGDAPEVRKIIDDANRRNPGRVKLVINGHHHCDYVRILNGVCYLDLNSASFQFMYRPHNLYPAEDCQGLRMMQQVLAYNDPINAVITLDTDGLIQIDGMESSFHRGITREICQERTGLDSISRDGRLTTARVQSFRMRLWPEIS